MHRDFSDIFYQECIQIVHFFKEKNLDIYFRRKINKIWKSSPQRFSIKWSKLLINKGVLFSMKLN